ncbi:MAG: hypothetical protein AAFX79_04725 [Planctomycetota bacterium]
MDDRQAQIKERAGLEESRINQDFVDFLKKWGPYALIAVGLVFAAINGKRWLDQKAEDRVDEAFRQWTLATSSDAASPDTLVALADQFGDVKGIPLAARHEAARTYLDAVRRGVVLGAQPQPDGTYPAEELLDGELREMYLAQARTLFERVAADAGSGAGEAVHAIRANLGLAAVAESSGDLDDARLRYERARELDRAAGYGGMTAVIDARLASLDALAQPVVLPARADLPSAAVVEEPADAGDDPFGLGNPGDFGDLLGGEPGDQPGEQTPPLVLPPEDPEPTTTEPATDPTPEPPAAPGGP